QVVSTDDYAPSQVDFTGHMDDSGDIVLNLDFKPVEDSVHIHCLEIVSGAWVDHDYSVVEKPQPLSVSVPASSEEVTVTRPQALVYGRQNASLVGQTMVIVETPPEAAASAQVQRQTARLSL